MCFKVDFVSTPIQNSSTSSWEYLENTRLGISGQKTVLVFWLVFVLLQHFVVVNGSNRGVMSYEGVEDPESNSLDDDWHSAPLESEIHGVEFRIQDCLGFPYMGR